MKLATLLTLITLSSACGDSPVAPTPEPQPAPPVAVTQTAVATPAAPKPVPPVVAPVEPEQPVPAPVAPVAPVDPAPAPVAPPVVVPEPAPAPEPKPAPLPAVFDYTQGGQGSIEDLAFAPAGAIGVTEWILGRRPELGPWVISGLDCDRLAAGCTVATTIRITFWGDARLKSPLIGGPAEQQRYAITGSYPGDVVTVTYDVAAQVWRAR